MSDLEALARKVAADVTRTHYEAAWKGGPFELVATVVERAALDALRRVRNETLEEAAQRVESWPSELLAEKDRRLIFECAAIVRAVKP